MTVLVLSGTTAGRRLAEAMVARGMSPISSLPSNSTDEPPGQIRRGGFGGAAGLAAWLRTHTVDAVVDATHPYARTMTRNAYQVCDHLGIPFLRVARRSWRERFDAGDWLWVADHEEACQAAGRSGAPVFLTVGRQPLWHYHLLPSPVTVRVGRDDGFERPADWHVVVARGALDLQTELGLLADQRTLVARDIGGTDHAAKLEAAAQLGVQVVMLARPELPGQQAESMDDALTWLTSLRGRS
ncbi:MULTISPECIES: precorrin-6A/cobalt-precorrin-6A reductase [unclassified Luteococcus]|uniref:precorrin-6A/cobalt-precorrin-6A reductase n=1 Tax=unclassified Luteococcus TaxID=2639923 RepID=UPI00313BD2A7